MVAAATRARPGAGEQGSAQGLCRSMTPMRSCRTWSRHGHLCGEGQRGDPIAPSARHLLDCWLRHLVTAEDNAAKDALVDKAAEAFLEFLAREMGFPKADAARAASTTARTRHTRSVCGRVRGAAVGQVSAGRQKDVRHGGSAAALAGGGGPGCLPEGTMLPLQASGW
jgi:hypothetical protein